MVLQDLSKLGNSAIASVAYVANKGTHLPSQMQPLNYLDPSLLSSLGAAKLNAVFSPTDASLYGISQPYPGWASTLTNVGTCKPTVAQALVQYPQYCNGLIGLNENQGTSMYNSFQTKIEKSFSSGLYLGANYTFSRLETNASSTTQATAGYGAIGGVISPFQGNRNYSLSPDDVTHSFSLLGSYDLPFGPGKRWLGQSGFLGHVVGGWTVSSSVKLVSGMPLYFRNSAVCGVPSQFQAQCIPAITDSSHVLLQSWDNVDVNKPIFNPAAFESSSLFASGNYLGTGPRVSSVRGSPYRDTNISLTKRVVIKERLNFEIRAEAFNVFNNHYFTCDGSAFGDCIPFNNDPSDAKFGTWSGTVTQPRNVQLVGRITF